VLPWFQRKERFTVRELAEIMGCSRMTVLRFLRRQRIRTSPRYPVARSKVTVAWNSLIPLLRMGSFRGN
jgi:IS30 family transposase